MIVLYMCLLEWGQSTVSVRVLELGTFSVSTVYTKYTTLHVFFDYCQNNSPLVYTEEECMCKKNPM